MIQPRTDTVSITEGPIWKGLLAFFFPILLGTFFQQLYNTVDAVVVGNFIGKEALAAAGGGTAIYINLLVGFFTGLSAGSTIIISQFFGAGRKRELAAAVRTAIWISVGLGIFMTAVGLILSRPALLVIETPQPVFDDSLLYLRIYFIGILPMFIYNMGAGVLRAAGDSKSPFTVLVAGCFINIVLDLLFVPVLKLGIAGAAWATVISQTFCMAVIIKKLHRNSSFDFRITNIKPETNLLNKMMRLGLPTGIQSSLYTISNLIIQSNVNSFGTDMIAAVAAYGRIDAFFWMTISSFGTAITTFAGQNYGAHLISRIKKGTAEGLLMMGTISVFYTVLFYSTGKYIFRLFTADAAVIEEGMNILRFLSPFFIVYMPIEVLSGTIHGAGDTFRPMIITMLGVCVLRIVWLFAAVPLHRTINTVLACYPVTWIATSIAFFIYYASNAWLKETDAIK